MTRHRTTRRLDRRLPIDRAGLQRRTLRVLVAAQGLSGLGLAAGITVGGLLGEDLIGSKRYAGLPAALFTLGSALAALLVGEISQRHGRRLGLTVGYLLGAVGGGGTVIAAATGSVTLLLVSLPIYGSGIATNLLARYAGADLAEDDHRGRGISTVLVATTVGAVIGPNLVNSSGAFAEGLGIRALAGPFIVATLAYAAAALVVQALLRPDPLLAARAFAAEPRAAERPTPAGTHERRAVIGAATIMLLAQMTMIAVMTITPIFMREHHHSTAATGLVISLHVGAMFFPSPVTGWLTDRVGRRPVVALGALTLAAAGVAAAVSPPESTGALATALVLLGLGWNFCIVGGTAIITDVVPSHRRARVQGAADVALAAAGAAGGLGSGFIVDGSSFAILALGAGALGLAILPLILALPSSRPAVHAEPSSVQP